MEIIQQISDSKTGLKREVELIRLVADKNYSLLMEVRYYTLIHGVKEYLPASIPVKEFVTDNRRRMLPNESGAISLFSQNDEGWEQAIPETQFYDYLLATGGVTLPDLLQSVIINLDSPKWNWFAE